MHGDSSGKARGAPKGYFVFDGKGQVIVSKVIGESSLLIFQVLPPPRRPVLFVLPLPPPPPLSRSPLFPPTPLFPVNRRNYDSWFFSSLKP